MKGVHFTSCTYSDSWQLSVPSRIHLRALTQQLFPRALRHHYHCMALLLDSLHQERQTAIRTLKLYGHFRHQAEINVSGGQGSMHSYEARGATHKLHYADAVREVAFGFCLGGCDGSLSDLHRGLEAK